MRTARQPLAVTLGDPAGVGPYLVADLWKALKNGTHRFIVFGAGNALAHLGVPARVVAVLDSREAAQAVAGFPEMLTIVSPLKPPAFQPGVAEPATAAAVLSGIRDATRAVRERRCLAMVTAPIAKAALEGSPHAGHTEYLKELCGSSLTRLLMVAGRLRVMPQSLHVPHHAVTIDPLDLESGLRLLDGSLTSRFGLRQPKILVTGLNPHAGEEGRLGLEEKNIIEPVVQKLQKAGLRIEGPLAADAIFIRHVRSTADAIVTMTHDQGMIPVKALAFSSAVNVTLGLPLIRTSPGHGTAYDIVNTPGQIDTRPMRHAYQLAIKLAKTV